MKFSPIYTLYVIDVPMINQEIYVRLMDKFPDFDVSDYDESDRQLWIGMSYDDREEQKKLLKKLTQGIEDYYRK